MDYLHPIDYQSPEFGDLYDELPLWSAPFGLLLLEQVALRPGMTILDVGAGTGFITIELAQRCGSNATVLDAHINRRATVESVTALLLRHGFEDITAVTRSFQERFVDGSALLRHVFMRLGFVQGWKAIAPEGAVEATFDALEHRLNTIAADHGELSLTIPVACIQARKPVLPKPSSL
jgi:precorrin-6B methylase 2